MAIQASGEDYLETILELEDQNGLVRSVEIARKLGVSRPSVNKAMNILKEAGMIYHESYGDISLTDKGRERANETIKRHRILKTFLIDILKIDEITADEDACKMEHVISDVTIAKWESFIEAYLNK
ncbi:MAG: metal-dependent transcriptional regulator [Firmicutes bacterium HGW-Firmicutes-7]|nr:MAG: metal-dependent transcriptional regulator [Firmicutes bacterium HGW-Firmicutes-7]